MSNFGITSTGFNKKTGAQIRQEYIELYKSIYGEDIQLNDGPIAQEIGVFSERESLIWDLAESLYLSATRDGASGASLDNVNSLIGVGRLEAQQSTVTMTLATTGGSDVTVPAGTQFNQPANNTLWETTAAAIVPAATNTVSATCTDITWQSGNTVRFQLASGTDLSGVTNGDMLNISGASITANNGLFAITNINDGSDYVDVTILTRIDGTGDEASITATATITDGYIEAASQASDSGANSASFGTITVIQTPVVGLDFANNLEAAQTGRAEETDTDYRRRAAASTVSAEGGTLAAVKARLLAEVDGVTSVFARENRTAATDGNGLPPHSQQYTIIGGTDADIVALIYEAKPAGINTFGTSSDTVTNDYGDSETIFFSRVTQITIHFDVSVTTDASFPADGADQIRDALIAYGDTLENGDDVINSTALGFITTNVPGILTITVLQGLSDPPSVSTNISIATTEIADITTGNIDVTVS